MYYKLYHNIFSDHPPEERRTLFKRLYEEYGVELIGVFRNRENPLEYFMITCYRDEQHYLEFTKSVKKISAYVEMTNKISAVRISNNVFNLEKL